MPVDGAGLEGLMAVSGRHGRGARVRTRAVAAAEFTPRSRELVGHAWRRRPFTARPAAPWIGCYERKLAHGRLACMAWPPGPGGAPWHAWITGGWSSNGAGADRHQPRARARRARVMALVRCTVYYVCAD